MSAFYDIWINAQDTPPLYKRQRNNNWTRLRNNCWASLPYEEKGFLSTAENGKYKLILVGQLYENITPAVMLSRCMQYINKPAVGYEDPAGHYIAFVISDSGQYVFTNRFGTYHAYYCTDGAISTCYLALAKNKKEKKLHWQGITGFMAMGYFPVDTTWLEGIQIFQPASCYQFDNEFKLIKQKRYWDWTYSPVEKPVEYFAEQLHSAIQSSLSVAVKDRNTCIPISGGLDSRLLAGELTCGQLKYRSLQGLCYGYTNKSPEIAIAKQIADKRDVSLYAYTMPDYLFEELDEVTEAVELFQYVDGTRQASARSWLQQNADVVVGGHWGDVWMDSMEVENTEGLEQAFQQKIIKKGATWLVENVCNADVRHATNELTEYFKSVTGRYAHIIDAPFLMKIYKTEEWSHRWTTASLRMYQAAAMPVLPFYDKNVANVLMTIPGKMLKGRAFEVEYLKLCYPDLARITWQEYDANLYNYKLLNNRNLAYRAADKIKRTLSSEKTIQRNWEVFYLNEVGRTKLDQHLLTPGLLQEIVSADKIKALLDDLQRSPTAANGYAVSMLLTFAMLIKKVVD